MKRKNEMQQSEIELKKHMSLSAKYNRYAQKTYTWSGTSFHNLLCSTGEWWWQEKTKVLQEKHVPVPLCLPQILLGLVWEWTQVLMVRDWWLSEPQQFICHQFYISYIKFWKLCYSQISSPRCVRCLLEVQWRTRKTETYRANVSEEYKSWCVSRAVCCIGFTNRNRT